MNSIQPVQTLEMKEYQKRKKKRLFHLYKSELNNSYKKTFFIRAFYTLVLNSLVFSLVSSSRCLVGLV